MSTARLLELATSTAPPGCAPCQRLAARTAPPPASAPAASAPPAPPLQIVFVAAEGHDNAVTVGGIDSITRKGSEIRATGTFDLGSADGIEAQRHVAEGVTTGVSVELDDVAFEVRVRQELIQAMEDELPALLDEGAGPMPAAPEAGPDGRVVVAQGQSDDELFVVTSARVRALTLVPVPALVDAFIQLDPADPARWSGVIAVEGKPTGDGRLFEPNSLMWDFAAPPPMPKASPGGMMPDGTTECSCTEGDDNYDPACVCGEAPAAVAASAQPTQLRPPWATQVDPPSRFFSHPRFDAATPWTITDEGWVYGHIASWDTCHIGHLSAGKCVKPPRSASGYRYFHTGSCRTAEGQALAIGRLTFGTTHAAPNLSAAEALAHYEHTGLQAMDLLASEDEYGIVAAGALRPRVTREQVRELRASPPSGDWRAIAGNLELIGILAVNIAGFPIPRPAGLVAGGQVQSLVAAGMVLPPAARDFRVRLPKRATVDVAAMRRQVTAAQLAARVHV